ncbi:DNA repair protein RecO [Frigidibacter sp. ROC022]|uniref:DNA repair protein RecO n=1 Tax=Frigidibacter sp. ROC022 TaxID=2971796 RepID=UPI00215B7292|nr:DNA repair protein RecO [Frigidibacter sp. ROC022]MCR8724306.1 DNA repair protein RecO [Frigidibacter sp. ROC022]
MEWSDQGTVLTARPHGETSAIIEVFTAAHGRHAGVVRGGVSRKMTPHLQPGNDLRVVWQARLEEHIGSYAVEPLRSRAAVFSDRTALAGLNAVTALLAFCLPEREPHPQLYTQSVRLLDALGGRGWDEAYLLWELALLEEMGFGLDLSECAVTGAREGLVHVSPRSGRAVSAAGAGVWADRLLPLPGLLLGRPAEPGDLARGLRTTGYFLERHLAAALGDRPLPEARARLVALLERQSAAG